MPDYPIKDNIKPVNSDIPIQSTEPAIYTPTSFSHADPPKKSIDDFFPGSTNGNEFPLTITSGQLQNSRFPIYDPSKGENEFAMQQGWGEKMVNGVGKGLVLTGTTFIQSTIGLLNGVGEWNRQGKFSAFYDNELNRGLDKINKEMEDYLPNYYTDAEKESHWYSPSKLFSANFLWDGIVKNLGFAAGAALAGGVYGAGLKGATLLLSQIPKLSKLVSIGKAAEALAATETKLLGAEKIGEAVSKIKNASSKFLTQYDVLNKAQRVTVAGLATTGEASFEALNNMNQYRDQKIAEYKETHGGNPPIGKDLEDINKASEEIGNWSLAWNIALLSATNYIQFPKILGSSYKAEKGVLNDVIRETREVVSEGGKFIEKPALGGVLGTANKIRPYLFSASEGFEEGAQYAITVGTQDYFDKKRLNKDADVISSIAEGVTKTLTTDEGMENVLIGGLSGAIMLGPGRFKENRIIDKNTKAALGSAKWENAGLNSANLSEFTKETIDSVNRGVSIQEEREAALKEGNITDSKDLEKDYIINYLTPRIKYGRFDLVKSDIEDYRKLASTEEGWAQLIAEGKAQPTDTKEAYLARLTKLEQTADNMKTMYQSLHIRYGGMTNEKGETKYSNDVLDKMIYAITKIADYDERITSLIPTISHPDLIASGVDVSKITADLAKGDYTSFNAATELASVMDDVHKDDVGEALNSIGKMVIRRERFRKEYEEMKSTPEKWTEKTKELTPEDIEKQQQQEEAEHEVELDTVKGKKSLKVGASYFLGSVVDYDKDGLEKPVEISEFKILKDNGDTIDVLTKSGEVKTISKDTFKKFSIGSLDSIKDNDNANYFYHHRNEKFQFNFGKDKEGKPILKPGRIEYKDGKLFFVYTKYIDRKTGKPVLRHIEVNREQFFAQGDFHKPMIEKIGAVESKEQREARERLTDEKKRKEENKKLEESTRVRNNLLTELFVDLSEKRKSITELIEKKKAELKNIIDGLALLKEDIESPESINKSVKKVTRFKKHAKKYLEASIRLSRAKEQIQDEVFMLERQQEDIDITLAYVDDITHYRQEASPDIEEFTKELEDQIALLELTKEDNLNQQKILLRLISSIEKAIDKIMGMLHSLISEFEVKYPKVPTAIIGQEWVDFLKVNPNFLKLKPNYKGDLAALEDIIAETEDIEITPNEKKAEEARQEVSTLQQELKSVEEELGATRAILEKFKPYAEKAKQQRIEEEKLGESSKQVASIEKTISSGKGERNADLNKHDKDYEPEFKKNDKHVITSTTTTDDGKDHQKRSNLFGARLPKFKESQRKKIRGVYITSENEHLLIPGLIDFLFPRTEGETDEEVKEKQAGIIALVMTEVDDKTGKITLIGVDGKPLKQGEDPLEKGIFQVFPKEELAWDTKWSKDGKKESMFRKTTPPEVQDSLRKQYAEWREKTIESTKDMEEGDLINVAFSINASFGIPSYVIKDDNSIDYTTRTSVEDAQLVSPAEMESHVVLTVPTTNTIIDKGSVRFTNASGRVFVEMDNGYARLQNRQLTNKEATVVYKVIHRLSKLAVENNMASEEAKRLLSYLRSVVFWKEPQKGDPEYLGRNNIFFKKDPKTGVLTLYISDDGRKYIFKPSAMEENKNSIIEDLQSLYMNINNHMLKDPHESYEEITDVDSEGNIKSNTWNNYQTFLLSKNTHDGKERANDDIPLTTWMKPITNENETNRHGIYFYVEDDLGETAVFPDYTTAKNKKLTAIKGKKKEEAVEEDYLTETEPEETSKQRTPEESKKLAILVVKRQIATDIVEKAKAAPKSSKKGEEEFTVGELESSSYTLDYDRKTNKGTLNTFTTKKGIKIRFLATSDVDMDNYMTSIFLDGNDEGFKKVVQIYTEAGKSGSEEKTKVDEKKPEKKNVEKEEEAFTVSELEGVEEEELNTDELESDEAKKAAAPITKSELTRKKKDPLTRIRRETTEEISTENWSDVENWLKKTFPHIPFYRVKNIITSTNGRQAWGMFKDGAIYIYQNAEIGTIYHEVFHAIWQMATSPEERQRVVDEFRRRTGSFYDVKSEKTINYSDASFKQIEEALAEEFRDYVHYKKVPVKPKDGRPYIVKLFADFVNFIKAFITGVNSQSAVEELFSKINTGAYKSVIPFESSLNFANKGIIDIEEESASENSDFSLVKLSDRERADVIEHMTYLVLRKFINDDESLFTIPNLKKSEIYPELKEQIFDGLRDRRLDDFLDFQDDIITEEEFKRREKQTLGLISKIDKEWDGIVDKHGEYLKRYNIDFDENDHINLHDTENTGREDYHNALKIDTFRKANAALKILLATLPKTKEGSFGKADAIRTSVNGVSLIPVAQTTISLWNKLAHATNIDDMMSKLRQMAKDDSNYRVLYKRLMKVEYDDTEGHSFEKINTVHASQLLNAFWNTFKKQNPSVQNIFILDNSEVVVGEASLSTAALQYRDDYQNNIITKKGFFKWNKKSKRFVGNPESVKDIVLDGTRPRSYTAFLEKLGIQFTVKEVENLRRNHPSVYSEFKRATEGIKMSISNKAEIVTYGGKALDIKGNLLKLGIAKSVATNPGYDSTFFNIVGERVQSYLGPNAASDLFDFLSALDEFTEETVRDTQYEYLTTDTFAQGSNIMKRKFDADGQPIAEGKELLKVGWAGGITNSKNGKDKESSRLTFSERLIQEINLNLKGWFLNLIPGDASIEWMIQMGKPISTDSLRKGMTDVHRIFAEYFISELNMAREEDRKISKKRKESPNDLRFFMEILTSYSPKLYKEIMKQEGDARKIYEDNKEEINKAVTEYIKNKTEKTQRVLSLMGVINEDEKGFTLKNIDLPSNMKEDALKNELTALTVNYIIANIEMHKILYSDPYQYNDELKRIKSFLSPRQSIIADSPSMNKVLDRVWNDGFGVKEIGFTNFIRDFFRTITLTDIKAVTDLPNYSAYDETDGCGIITFKAYRNFRIRAGSWYDKEERQYRYDIAWEKNHKGLTLTSEDEAILAAGNPMVKSAYTPLKPIVAGNKANGRSYNDIVLDKYALYPLSYRVLSDINSNGGRDTSNSIALYDKMQKEDIDYAVFNSGRKVGAEETNDVYNKNGSFKTDKYKGIINVPFAIMSVQTEVPSKDSGSGTRGSQATKLITMDFMEAGVPVDFLPDEKFNDRYEKWYALSEDKKSESSELFKEIKNNQNLLESLMDDGYNSLLNKLGIKETTDKKGNKRYEFSTDASVAINTLKDEILKREVNDNLMDALASFEKKTSLLESTTAYQQVRNILYSIVDTLIVSPKMPGGQKVQIPVSLFEQKKLGIKPAKGGYQSDTLRFYSKTEDGKKVNVCEMMLPRWFKSDKTDAELIEYLNTTEEGKRILRGIAFRIPTQKQNSIDVFVIKQFLPREFGDVVVVPSELVQKAGSDFDIDKLSIYLKNVITQKGLPKLVEFLTDENSSLEERYVKWIRSKVNRDVRKYVKFLSKDIIRGLRDDFKADLDRISNIYKTRKQIAKEEAYQELVEKYDEINDALKHSEQQSYLLELFAEGKRIFFNMSDEARDAYWGLKEMMRLAGTEGVEEIQNYLFLTEQKLENNENPDDREDLENLVKIYTEELRVIGIGDAWLAEHREKAREEFRKNKSIKIENLISVANKVREQIKSESDEKFDQHEVTASEEMASIQGLPSIDEFETFDDYHQNTKEALENAYIESSDALISHPLNYDQLIKPNSAKQLKGLGESIAKKIHGQTFNYEAIDNMLDRTFMSRLRHAFVSGKQAIAIAAVSQTNHSLNQRQPITIDTELLKRVSEEDRPWLGDGLIKFQKFNKIRVGNRLLPTLSKIKNAAGQHISDIIAQFIDGYVDISKGPWIMELGASPNVASTFLFLAKIGVPIDTISYFMNQPLIHHYLRELEGVGYVWLFNDAMVDAVKSQFATDEEIKAAKILAKDFKIPSDTELWNNIGEDISKFSKQRMMGQLIMLDEFFKYAKMANHLYSITNATNYDTATFNDPLLIWKKGEQMKKANQTVINSAESLLENSFIGKLPKVLGSVRDAIATLLASDQTKVRGVLQEVLKPYVDMSDKDFLKIAKKATADIFDWAVQTDDNFNQYIKELFKGGAVDKVADFVEKVKADEDHPLHGNHVINLLQIIPSKKGTDEDAFQKPVNNIRIKSTDNSIYDQNNIIYAFREIRKYLGANDPIYRALINIAIVQSGLSPSKISYTSLIPFEDFAKVYNKTMSRLEKVNFQPFIELGVFYRNNWHNDDIVSRLSAFWIPTKKDKMYNIGMKFFDKPAVEKAIEIGRENEIRKKKGLREKEGGIPPLVTIPMANKESNEKYIFYTWNLMEELLTEDDWADIKNGKVRRLTRIFAIQEKMRNDGDFSYMKKALFEKVVDSEGKPLTKEYNGKVYIVYKAINAWGDGNKANEFYAEERPSVIDSGLENPPLVENSEIISLFLQPNVKKTKRADGYMSNAALDDEYSKKSPVAKVVKELEGQKTMVLKQGTFKYSEISSKLLSEMGYSPKEIGEILKKICG